MSYTRDRSRDLSYSLTGTWNHSILGPRTETNSVAGSETCTDVVGNWESDNPFTLQRISADPVYLDGVKASNASTRFNMVPLQLCHYSAQVPQHRLSNSVPETSELNQLAVSAIAKTNPHKPEVAMPAFLGELREIPETVRKFGVENLKLLAERSRGGHLKRTETPFEAYLAMKWAILPTLSDVRKLLAVSCNIRKRMMLLDRLARGETIRRHVDLGSTGSDGLNGSQTCWSQQAFAHTGPRTDSTFQKTWASVRWSLADDAPLISLPNDKLYHEALKSVNALTPEGLGLAAWELLPWSWFVDWFTSAGDLLGAIQGSLGRLPMSYKDVCVMRYTRTVRSGNPYSSTAGVTVIGRMNLWRETKVRRPVPHPNPVTIYVPFLKASQWSVLSSLASLKALKRVTI